MKRQPNVRTANVQVERKENMVFSQETTRAQTSTANTTSNRNFSRTASRMKGLAMHRIKRETSKIKTRPLKQDVILKSASATLATTKLKSDLQIIKSESPKRMKVASYQQLDTNPDRYKLKEICFMKQNLSKKVIAKFNKESRQDVYDDNEDLVVAWDSDLNPVVSVTDRPDASKCGFRISEASTSSKLPTRGTLKSNSYISNKVKRPKNSLRRLASANIESTGKVDKLKKRKKLKSKII